MDKAVKMTVFIFIFKWFVICDILQGVISYFYFKSVCNNAGFDEDLNDLIKDYTSLFPITTINLLTGLLALVIYNRFYNCLTSRAFNYHDYKNKYDFSFNSYLNPSEFWNCIYEIIFFKHY